MIDWDLLKRLHQEGTANLTAGKDKKVSLAPSEAVAVVGMLQETHNAAEQRKQENASLASLNADLDAAVSAAKEKAAKDAETIAGLEAEIAELKKPKKPKAAGGGADA